MKRLLYVIIVILLVSCQKTYNVQDEILSLENALKEDNTNETTYINLFKAYIINDDYFNAVRTIDKSLEYSQGTKTKELINDLKDGYDIFDVNDTFYKRILIDYDINFDPFYEDKRNIDYYQGNTPRIGGNYDSSYYVSEYLSSNNQKLFKKSNYTIYILDKDDTITNIYQYTYSIANQSFYNLSENHYIVKNNSDGTIYYARDDGWNYYFKDEKIIKIDCTNSENSLNEDISFEYDDSGRLLKLVESSDDGVITTEFERYDDGSPSKIRRYSELNENKEFNISSHTTEEISEYTKDGRMLSRINYFNGELSSSDTFEFNFDNRIIREKGIDYNNSDYDYEYTYTYNDNGYIDRKDNLINTDNYDLYIYNDDYSKVSVCSINKKSRDCQEYDLYN